ncbi:aminotransferase class I/II-fold pyridoxal phosphate-dependent enzyme [Ectobacillus panaciterrae]|uniref:aminotransferase class I/II-fold pyridoxal phosphate-dependent enzyme n=1 Tax=Ectobacillus panaciterrae TaxID=363872 RepID=UPI0003F9F55B|nr:aminotransferase class I/II-fold pyridoxal phosphate-dependent enzyme [Ectobacillus panaciterrae]
MKQTQTPLYNAISHFSEKRPISFHVPGHKNGMHFAKRAFSHFHSLLEIDVTELTGLDDLHNPSGCIKEAETLLADLYGASQSYFLINGSTVGNLAMILAACKEGDIVLVQRNCHKSVMNGIQLAGARPVFLRTAVDEHAQVPMGIAFETAEAALQQYPQAKAVVLTHPNYYGMAQDLHKIISLAHEKGIPVLVDEAHGAHFCLGAPFPSSALAYGADVVIHSAHKTLPAMTMGSYLHINSNIIKTDKVFHYLSMLQSSSPSYPIMASLDLARYELAQLKAQGTEKLVRFLQHIRQELSSIPQVAVLQHDMQDPLKVTIQTRCALSGYELQAVFEKKGIYTEMADPYNVLLVLPLYIHEQYVQAVSAMRDALKLYSVTGKSLPVRVEDAPFSAPMDYKELEQYPVTRVPLIETEGYVAAETVIPYPPGIPFIMPGEMITNDHIKQLQLLIKAGARFQGTASLQELAVYDRKGKVNAE